MFFLLLSHDHNTYHRRFRDTWRKWAKEVTRPFAFQPKALEMFENQYKSELLIRSHPRGRGFESLQVHQNKRPSERMVFYFVMDRGAEAYTLKGRIFLPCNMRGAYSGLRI